MWVLTGAFDVEFSKDLPPVAQQPQRSKLLKTGRKYELGRKDKDLIVTQKKVSKDNAHFIVGGWSPEDVAKPNLVPSLHVFNPKQTAMKILRGEDGVPVNPGQTVEMLDGDALYVVSGLPITARWVKVCCFETPGKVRTPVSLEGCASLGINVVRTLDPAITHHLIPSFSLSPPFAASLLSAANFVKPEWLRDLLKLGAFAKTDPNSLEFAFALPLESKYRPGFGPGLKSALKNLQTWEPNEERLNMFKGMRFVFVGEKGREIGDGYRDVVERGQGVYEAFTVASGPQKWRRLLAKSKAWEEEQSGKVALVAGGEAMEAAVGADSWEEFIEEAKSFGLKFILPENILQAVAYVDKFYVDSSDDAATAANGAGSALPECVPNTHVDEPSIAPDMDLELPTPLRSSTRARSRQPSQAPASPPPAPVDPPSKPPEPEPEVEITAVRRPPRRRGGRSNLAFLGLDEDSLMNETPAKTTLPSAVEALPAPSPALSTTLLTQSGTTRRRRNNSRSGLAMFGLEEDDKSKASAAATQLDKFKSLFDESHPDRFPPASETLSGLGTNGSLTSESQTQAPTQAGGARTRTKTLAAVAEEEEEGSSQSGATQGSGKKRKAIELDAEDAEMQEMLDDPDADMEDAAPSTQTQKKRAIEGVNAVKPASQADVPKKPASMKYTKPTSGAKKGGENDEKKMDTDDKFLKAVNSTKRGKKKEDAFDRDFNKLRIPKPDIERDAQKAEWEVLADFGNDNVRGNFMVIVELDVDTSVRPVRRARGEGDPEWAGKPDYKKFMKKAPAGRRKTIELVVSESVDDGMDASIFRPKSRAASESQSLFDRSSMDIIPPRGQSRTQTQGKGKGKMNDILEDSDEDPEVAAPTPAPRATRARGKTKTPAPTRASSRAKSQQPLFLDDEDEDNMGGGRLGGIGEEEDFEILDDPYADEDGMTTTLRSSRASVEPTPRTTAKRTAGTKRKAPAPIQDDDSDEGTFKGFKGRKRGRVV
ncbi:hypothetical protein OF83DRAFT_1132275 [Amylostereum chailletii]|nr:hypothetical protein OF83DRAFT_1132275 [Amylostereum chailletii]